MRSQSKKTLVIARRSRSNLMENTRIRTSLPFARTARLIIFFSLFTFVLPAQLHADGTSAWEQFIDKKIPADALPVVTNRAIKKSGKFQIVGPAVGISGRQDLYSHTVFSLAARYHFSEGHAWEFLRVHYDNAVLSDVAREVITQTGYQVDAKLAPWSLSTGYVFTPVYGKYALSESTLVNFDMYIGASIGARFIPSSAQLTFEPFIGATHWLTPYLGIMLPEIRVRLYTEQRTVSNDFISEIVGQVGVTWLF
jgi:outer membrane beta-barrel protein